MRQSRLDVRTKKVDTVHLEQALQKSVPLASNQRIAWRHSLMSRIEVRQTPHRFRHASDQRHRFSAGSDASLLSATPLERIGNRIAAMQQQAHTPGAPKFVGGETEQIDGMVPPGDQTLGDHLGGIGMKGDSSLPAGLSDLENRLQTADFALPPDH